MRIRVLVAAALLCVGCSSSGQQAGPDPSPSPSTSASTPSPTATSTPSAAPTPTPSPTPSPLGREQRPEKADPRWRFFTNDATRWSSPWFAGQHRVMIGYGCTPAPYYDHDTRCPGRQGFHHGIDVAMACGTVLRSAVAGTVLSPTASGAPGAAYGVRPFRIRTGRYDVLIGHARTVFVRPGQQVRPGQRIALSSDSGAPDGCHLHFEVRRAGGGLSSAVDPAGLLRLAR